MVGAMERQYGGSERECGGDSSINAGCSTVDIAFLEDFA